MSHWIGICLKSKVVFKNSGQVLFIFLLHAKDAVHSFFNTTVCA